MRFAFHILLQKYTTDLIFLGHLRIKTGLQIMFAGIFRRAGCWGGNARCLWSRFCLSTESDFLMADAPTPNVDETSVDAPKNVVTTEEAGPLKKKVTIY